jgi:hypothetical protein
MAKKTGKTVKPKKTNTRALRAAGKAAPKRTIKKTAAPKKKVEQEPVLTRLPNVYGLSKKAALLIWQYRKLFIGLTIVYGLLNLVLVQGLANSTDVSSLKSELNQVFTGHLGSIVSGLGVFAVLVSTAGNGSSQTAGAYQIFLTVVASLAVIWSLRQVMLGHKVRIRDAYYKGMYPLIPFVLVLIVIIVQLIPLIVGAELYSTVITGGIAISIVEKAIFAVIGLALAYWSFYMLSSSIFAIYIVTLQDMTPMLALKSAKQLALGRRWQIVRKILALPVILIVIAAVIMLPIIIIFTILAQWVFFLLTMFSLVALHAYVYTLYRELIGEQA